LSAFKALKSEENNELTNNQRAGKLWGVLGGQGTGM